MTNQPLFAGIDLGTSGCRLMLIDPDHQIQSDKRIAYPSGTEQTPELWWNSVSRLLGELPQEIRHRMASLAIDGTSGTVLLANEAGEPCSDVLMYHDLRATSQAEKIARLLPPDSGAQGAASGLARILWLWEQLDDNARNNCKTILNQADLISSRLLGRTGISDENNCLKLGFDSRNQKWPKELKHLPLPVDLFPDVVPAGTPIGNTDPLLAQKLDLPPDLIVVAGTTDSIAAFLATGVDQCGDAVTSLGSTLVLKLVTHKPIFDARYGIYSHRLGGLKKARSEALWLVGGASNSGGNVLRHYFSEKQLDSLSRELHPQQLLNLAYYPLVNKGERFPLADPEKSPQMTPRQQNDVDFLQAILEGIADIEVTGYRLLQSLGAAEINSVRSVGGGSRNTAWSQIRESKLKVPVITPEQTEAAYGSALLAANGFELFTKDSKIQI